MYKAQQYLSAVSDGFLHAEKLRETNPIASNYSGLYMNRNYETSSQARDSRKSQSPLETMAYDIGNNPSAGNCYRC